MHVQAHFHENIEKSKFKTQARQRQNFSHPSPDQTKKKWNNRSLVRHLHGEKGEEQDQQEH